MDEKENKLELPEGGVPMGLTQAKLPKHKPTQSGRKPTKKFSSKRAQAKESQKLKKLRQPVQKKPVAPKPGQKPARRQVQTKNHRA